VVQTAHQAEIPVAICGEMAAEPAYALVLLGMGLDEFSMTPASIPRMKRILRSSRFEDAVALVDRIFQFQTASEIESYVRKWMVERFQKDFTAHSSVQDTKGSS
jgi:phosphotransferase system enzyme I (PtsI)